MTNRFVVHFLPLPRQHHAALCAAAWLAAACAVGDPAAWAQEAAPAAAHPAVEGYRDTPLLPGGRWHVHDPTRPQPEVVTPGTFSAPAAPGQPPSDAVVLFDGHDLTQWQDGQGHPAPWKVADGVMVSTGSDIQTKQEFGDVQVHVEFCEPSLPDRHGQGRGNSGVFLQGRYEVQVLDSYRSQTYPDGMLGAVYGQHPPLVNAARPPGEWQVYDIVFTAARFGADGVLAAPAYATVFLNGVLVQNHFAILGPTGHRILARYQPTGLTGPLKLQFHGNEVRYRNIWVRPLVAEE